jgi:hypothetical protein
VEAFSAVKELERGVRLRVVEGRGGEGRGEGFVVVTGN